MNFFRILSTLAIAYAINGAVFAQTETNGGFNQEVIKTTVPFKSGFFSSEKQVEIIGILLTITNNTKRPYPIVIFNHGSQDSGTTVGNPITAFAVSFLKQGYAVFVPARKGFNHSQEEKSSVSADSAEPVDCRSLPLSDSGLNSAKQDVRALFEALKAKKFDYLDTGKVILAGSSRGGFLSLALAEDKFPGAIGVINFSGGWSGEPCPGSSIFFNTRKFKDFGEKIDIPVISFYGDKDTYYSPEYTRGFIQLLSVNKKSKGLILSGQTHTSVIHSPTIWTAEVAELLKQ
jgi:pimeloyl-ACP methyl ester carboxylesterase